MPDFSELEPEAFRDELDKLRLAAESIFPGWWQESRWLHPLDSDTSDDRSMSSSSVQVAPLASVRSFKCDQLGIDVYTGVDGCEARLVLYGDDGRGLPGPLLIETGVIALDVDGWVTIAIDPAIDIPAGILWTGGYYTATPNGSSGVRSTSHSNIPQWWPSNRPFGYHGGTTTNDGGFSADLVGGAAPDPWPEGSYSSNRWMPRVLARGYAQWAE